MPNEHGQVTDVDFKAPAGQFRLIMENMEDGELVILADYYDLSFARKSLQSTREYDEKNVYTLCDENGRLEE